MDNGADSKRDELFQYMQEVLQIPAEILRNERTKTHPPVHTIEAWKPHAVVFGEGVFMCKNLFLRDKKKGIVRR